MRRPPLFLAILFMASFLPLTAGTPPITETEIALMRTGFESLTGYRDRVEESINRSLETGRLKQERADEMRKHLSLQVLRALMGLEHNLILLSTPAGHATRQSEVPGLSPSDNARIPKLRLEILVEERKRIKTEMSTRGPIKNKESIHRTLLRKEESLAALFEKASGKIDRDIKKLEKDLAKEEKTSIPDEGEIAELRAELDTLLEERRDLFIPVYGFEYGSGFDPPITLTPESAEQLRLDMKAKRESLLKSLREDTPNKGENEKRSGLVGGSYLYSANLGVILDVSGSMTHFIDDLKKEIAQSFNNPHYREIVGCKLREDSPTSIASQRGVVHTMAAIEELIVVQEVDTIYWFCDLQDGHTVESVRRLRHLFTRKGVAFHVKSVGRKPKRELEAIITDFQR